jgi:hypothetical protein
VSRGTAGGSGIVLSPDKIMRLFLDLSIMYKWKYSLCNRCFVVQNCYPEILDVGSVDEVS